VLDQGTVLPGGYRVSGVLGRGSLADVYAVVGPTGQAYAVKMLHDRFVGDAHSVARFEAEADMLASVRHHAVIGYRSRGAWGRRPFLVMEVGRGRDLASELSREAPFGAAWVRQIGLGLLDAVLALHQHGIVHRDIKPANVFVADDAAGLRVQVIDLGSGARISEPKTIATFESDRLTPPGRVMLTPHYASRESLTGVWNRDPRGDLYAVAVLMFQMLTGHLPFDHADQAELIRRIVSTAAPPLSVFGTAPSDISALVERALDVDTERRFPDAASMRDALHACV